MVTCVMEGRAESRDEGEKKKTRVGVWVLRFEPKSFVQSLKSNQDMTAMECSDEEHFNWPDRRLACMHLGEKMGCRARSLRSGLAVWLVPLFVSTAGCCDTYSQTSPMLRGWYYKRATLVVWWWWCCTSKADFRLSVGW